MGHNRTGSDEGVPADFVSADDSAIGAEGGALFNEGRLRFVHSSDMRPGVDDICENHAGATEDVVFQSDSFINGYVVLNLASIPDGHIRSDHHILPDVAGFANHAAVQDVREMPDFGPFADDAVFVDDCRFMAIVQFLCGRLK